MKSPRSMITACCLCAALAFSPPSLAAGPPAAEAEPGPRTLSLTVNVDELGDKAIGLDDVIIKQLTPTIVDAGFVLVDEDEAATVLLVRLRPLKSSPYDYGVHFEFVDEGHRQPVVEWVECHLCVDSSLLPLLDDRLPAVLMALEARAEELAAEPTGDGDGDGSEAAPKPITGLGIGGVVVAGLGIGVLIGGGVELSRGLVIDDRLNEQRKRVDHRPPGYALVGVGATALVAGVVMLGVDLARQSKQRKAHAQAKRAQVFPILTPGSVGLGVVGRF
jgi:hypothetical protein